MAAKKTPHAIKDRSRLSAVFIPASRARPSKNAQENKRTKAWELRFVPVALLAILSINCNFGRFLPGGSGSTGPIVTMTAGGSVNRQEGLTDAKFTFEPSAPQIAVVVQVGKLASPAPITITWYQVTDQGDQELFKDTVQVSAFERAYSIGKNPGKLAEGDYKIVAVIDGQTQQIEMSVAQLAQIQTPTQNQSAPPGTSQAQKSQPPVSGGSGAIPVPAAEGSLPPPPTPKGQHWTGIVHSTITADYGSPGTCSNEKWSSKFDAYVAVDDETVSGSGIGHRSSGPLCVGPGVQADYADHLASNMAFDVNGTFDGKKFRLLFHETDLDGPTPGLINYSFLQNLRSVLEPLFVLAVTGKGSAGGSITISRFVPDAGAATAKGQHDIDMKCLNC